MDHRIYYLQLCIVVAFLGCADGREKTMAAEISEHFKNYAERRFSLSFCSRLFSKRSVGLLLSLPALQVVWDSLIQPDFR